MASDIDGEGRERPSAGSDKLIQQLYGLILADRGWTIGRPRPEVAIASTLLPPLPGVALFVGALDPPRRVAERTAQVPFSTLVVERYRRLGGVELPDLQRINVIVGANNTGKTTILEAIHLLAHLNDDRALLELIVHRRARMAGMPDVRWLIAQLPQNVRITARFDEKEVALGIGFSEAIDSAAEDQEYFRGALTITSKYGEQQQSSVVRFYEEFSRPRRVHYEGDRWLCRSLFQSLFSFHSDASLMQCHRASIESGTKPRIIEFLRTHVEPGLRNIELADQYECFIVTHDCFPPMDLSAYGDGLRRIFHTSLLFAGARGGVVLIDEFENALHVGLLRRFSRFVQELAVEFDVQVFLTTHSKEVIDAFLFNDYRLDDIVGYGLTTDKDGRIAVQRVDGARLKRLVNAVDFDLRGL